MDYASRQRVLRQQLERLKLDALLVTHLPNVRYLCGFTGSAGVLVVHAGHPVFFSDGRYAVQAREEVQGARVVIARVPAPVAAAQWAAGQGFHSIGLEAQHVTLSLRQTIRRSAGARVRWREVGPVIETLRAVKDTDEIRLIREAARLGTSLFSVALERIRPGVSENEVAGEMEYEARRRGAEAMSFETIVAAGPRSALPHGRASHAAIPARGFVVLDFGVILHGYCSDMTRTVYVGKVSTAERKTYAAVREAQQAGIEAVQAGVTCGQVDWATRSVLRRAGLARYFTHSTGHGVGLEIHESPRLARNQMDGLQSGMVITIEPGAYIPRRGGVRIEDMVLVCEGGREVLTPLSKELIVL